MAGSPFDYFRLFGKDAPRSLYDMVGQNSGEMNPFEDILENSTEGQRGAFGQRSRRFATSPRRSDQLLGMFDDARQEFMTEMAGEILGPGGVPIQTWSQYLDKAPRNGGYDFTHRLARQAGIGALQDRSYNPRTRHLPSF